MNTKKTINRGVWIFALIILIIAVAGFVVTLLWQQWKHAVCYLLIIAGISMFLYNNRKSQ